MFVFVDPQEQALLERFGSPVANRGVLEPGFHFKWPWPVDAVYRYPVRSLQTFTIGVEQDESKYSGRTVVWTVQHNQAEYNMLVASRDTTSGTDTDVAKAVPVNLLTVSIPVQYYFKDLKAWMYNHANAGDLLQRIATREVVRYLVSVDLIDLRTIYPVDIETIAESVRKTGRAVVFHEAPKTAGFGAEISAIIQEHCFLHLQAPVQRVTGFDTVMPYYKLENDYLPDAARITRSIRECLAY